MQIEQAKPQTNVQIPSPVMASSSSVDFSQFKMDIDSWIKTIRAEFSEFQEIPAVVENNCEDIQENYENIVELKEQVKELKQELYMMKLMQLKFLMDS